MSDGTERTPDSEEPKAKAKRRKSRPWGSVETRPPRPGYYCAFHWRGERYVRRGGSTPTEARKKLSRAHNLLESGVRIVDVLAEVFKEKPFSVHTFRTAIDEYLVYAKTRKRATTYAGDAPRLKAWCRDAAWTGRPLSEVTPQDLTKWVDARKAEGLKDSTLNRDLALVSAVFKWAIRLNYVQSNPARKVERFKTAGTGREVFLTASEARALIGASSPILAPVVLAALHTGMRKGELLGLRWRDVDRVRGEILIRPEAEKAGRGRVVVMSKTLTEEFNRLHKARKRPAIDGSDHVFTDLAGDPLTPWVVRRLFDEAVARCAPTEGQGEDGAGIPLAKRATLRPHDLRHTAASLLVAEGVPLFDVAKVLGHASLAVTMRYAHRQPRAAQSAADRLDGALARAEDAKPEALRGAI